jgi:hypothetical protein
VCCATVLIATMGEFTAHADDLEQEKAEATKAIAHAQDCVQDSDAALRGAEQRVTQATSRVSEAQGVLNVAEKELKQAEEVSATKKAELDQANQVLTEARAKEAEGQAKVDAQRTNVAAYARAVYQDNLPLISVATLLGANTTADLANRVQWTDTVLVTNQVDLDYLNRIQTELGEARLISQRAQLAATEAKQIADHRTAQAQEAKDAAAAARDRLQRALNEENAARQAAAQALEADKAALAEKEARTNQN